MEACGVFLGVFHCTHRLPNQKIHVGGSSRVYIPKGCFILFHASLYHYGDKCLVDGGRVQTSIRGFTYMVEKGYVEPARVQTWVLQKIFACEKKGCMTCGNLFEILNKFQDKNGMSFGPTSFDHIDKGDILYGDLEHLGWVVIVSDNDLFNSDLDLELAAARRKPTSVGIGNIDVKETHQFSSLSSSESEEFKKLEKVCGTGTRSMLYEKSIVKSGFSEKAPNLMHMFQTNLDYASKIIKDQINIDASYTFYGPNLLFNAGGMIPEQRVHRDFIDPRAKK